MIVDLGADSKAEDAGIDVIVGDVLVDIVDYLVGIRHPDSRLAVGKEQHAVFDSRGSW